MAAGAITAQRISQRKVGGNCCGACAASYALSEFRVSDFTASDIRGLWGAAQFAGGFLGGAQYIDPTKLSRILADKYRLKTQPTLSDAAPRDIQGLKQYVAYPADIAEGEGMDELRRAPNRRFIGIFAINGDTNALHYMLVKYEDNSYWIIDSNDEFPAYQRVNDIMVNTDVTTSGSGSRSLGYQYMGGGIQVRQ